ncbi:MAG: thioredoxin-dependent thiol peroxidase [Fibrobacterota bacterium]|nr:thioredoxin-dependent thiol peroxidase [Fibrobacterota bacterium]
MPVSKKTAPKKPASTEKVMSKATVEASYGPKTGSKAPAFKLSDDSGKTVSLSDFKGKKVILFFYPKDNTPGCTSESCDFRDNLNRFVESGAAVLGISADSVESHRKFKEKQGLNFPLLSDPDHKALDAYGVWQEKSLYGRRFMGIVRSTFVVDGNGKIAKVFPKVKVNGHVDEVLASLTLS